MHGNICAMLLKHADVEAFFNIVASRSLVPAQTCQLLGHGIRPANSIRLRANCPVLNGGLFRQWSLSGEGRHCLQHILL